MGEQGYAIVSSEHLEQQVIEIDEADLDNLDALFDIENDEIDDEFDGENNEEISGELDDELDDRVDGDPSTVKQSKRVLKKGANKSRDTKDSSLEASDEVEHINASSSHTKGGQGVEPHDKVHDDPYGDKVNDVETNGNDEASHDNENDALHEDTVVMRFQYVKARRKYAKTTSGARFSAHNVIASVTPVGVTFLFTDFGVKTKKSDAKEFDLCATKVADAVNKTCKRLTPKAQ